MTLSLLHPSFEVHVLGLPLELVLPLIIADPVLDLLVLGEVDLEGRLAIAVKVPGLRAVLVVGGLGLELLGLGRGRVEVPVVVEDALGLGGRGRGRHVGDERVDRWTNVTTHRDKAGV